jgi:pimeloyl-ACP methyl ester carboxylesterase
MPQGRTFPVASRQEGDDHGAAEPGGPVTEAAALSRLAADELSALPGGIGHVHAAIAGRVFGALGPLGAPVRVVHDGVSRAAYGSVRGGLRVTFRAAGGLAARRSGPRPLSATPRGAALLAAVDGLIGDALEREGNVLAAPMAFRVAGEIASPDPGRRPVVFLHGLGESEFAWGDYDVPGRTSLFVRYNTGRHVSENGASLDALLETLPDVDEIALVGHSMGGLVARSACCQGAERGAAWTSRVRHVVSLGTPHMGAPLAQGVHWLSAGLNAIPEMRPLARFLRRRSAGIRDLRYGSLVDEDWRGVDPDALRARACREVPLLEGATHCFVSATVTASESHPVGRLIGDTLVLSASASGRSRTRRIPFEEEYGLRLGSTHHLALLNHPEVAARLRVWLA